MGALAEELIVNKRIAFFVAGTALVAGTPSMALGAAPTESDAGSAADTGTGDAEVSLLNTTTPPIYPGQDAWVVLPWTVKNGDAREFEVTSISSDGIEIAYPENTGDYTSLFADSTLSTFEIDYTALRVHVDPEAEAPRVLDVTVSYVSDTGAHEEVVAVPVEIDETPFEGDGLAIDEGSLGELAQNDIQWLSLGLEGLEEASNVELRVLDAAVFEVVYPAERDHSRPNLGRDVHKEATDQSAIRFETDGVAAGTYPVTIEASYFVGSTQIELTVERDIVVLPGENDSVLYNSAVDPGDWTINPDRRDSAESGQWDISVPENASWEGIDTQLGYTPSGAPGVITTGAVGSDTGDNDVDGGRTSAVSPVISLPSGEQITMDLSYYFAYLENATEADYFRLSIVVGRREKALIYETAVRDENQAAEWIARSFDLSKYAGKDVQIRVEAADENRGSLIEAAVADIVITKGS